MMTAAEMRVAAARARNYPPGWCHCWGASDEFNGDCVEAVELLAKRPDLLEAG